jgi:hypothetical protein
MILRITQAKQTATPDSPFLWREFSPDYETRLEAMADWVNSPMGQSEVAKLELCKVH